LHVSLERGVNCASDGIESLGTDWDGQKNKLPPSAESKNQHC